MAGAEVATPRRGVLSSPLAIVVIVAVGAALLGDPGGQFALGVLVFTAGWGARLQDVGSFLPLG